MLPRILILFACTGLLSAQDVSPEIRVDQVGYLPSAPKLAFFAGAGAAETFSIHRASDGKQLFAGPIGDAKKDAASGDALRALDFTQFREPGEYYIVIPKIGRSYKFAIAQNVYQRAWYLAMRAFYGQRCGTRVDLGEEFPGYKYEACHTNGAWHVSSGKEGERVSSKGWHDAGDYGRYVVNSGITTATLLWTYEMFKPRVESVSLRIPESGNGTPDILNEIRWNLDWMLTMQDDDGGVWHKQTSAKFPGFVMPDRDNTVSVVVGTGNAPFKSTCATADLAGVMAIAARVYAKFDADFAKRTLHAGARAWAWAEANPSVTFRNPPGVSTGAYGDGNCSDERLWASAELWRTTGEAKYQDAFLAHYKQFLDAMSPGNPPSWGGLAQLGLWTYAFTTRQGSNADAQASIRNATLAVAAALADRTLSNPYRITLTTGDYHWGSNSVAMNDSLTLLIAHRFDSGKGFRDAAIENLHYLLGRNAFSVSWVTWTGTNWFKHPHHRPSGADGIAEPWPGLLSGGPNKARQDAALKKLPEDVPPMRAWVDSQESYAGNEIAINWNAPLVFVLAGALPEQR